MSINKKGTEKPISIKYFLNRHYLLFIKEESDVCLFLTKETKPTIPTTTTINPSNCAPGLSSASPNTNIKAPRNILERKEKIINFLYID